MPIQPLSDATCRLLTSTQTLNTATSIVKELVDNALDARAASVSIEIAANTLDKIVLRDDGFGIGVEDRQLLCRRGCTSKITNLDDLAKLGGTFLGFRGTALASIAELSKEVVVVTKIDGERAATTLTFGPNGRLLSSASASHNVGTTVRVEDFLGNIPVRRQVVLKNPSKVLDEIKKLVQAYALARPQIKFSLKVLKAKSEKHNWSFAACKGQGQLLAAAIQVVGKTAGSFCTLQSVRSTDDEGNADIYEADAFLLNIENKDLSKCGNFGQYISVDGRPVSQEKGIIRDLVKAYKTHLRLASGYSDYTPSKPFLVLHLKCPARSYDVNVEPAKDVVLFHNPSKIIDLTETLFAQCYATRHQQEIDCSQSVSPTSRTLNTPPFNIMFARRRPNAEPDDCAESQVNEPRKAQRQNQVSQTDTSPSRQESLIDIFTTAIRSVAQSSDSNLAHNHTEAGRIDSSESKSYHNMQENDEELEDLVLSNYNEELVFDEEEDYDPTDININNPFTRAKIHSVQRSSRQVPRVSTPTEVQNSAIGQANILLQSPSSSQTPTKIGQTSSNLASHPLTPSTSPVHEADEPFRNPGPPFPRRTKQRRQADGVDFDEPLEFDPLHAWSPQSISAHSERVLTSSYTRLPNHTITLPSDAQRGEHHLFSSLSEDSEILKKPYRSPLKSVRLGVSSASPNKDRSKKLSRGEPNEGELLSTQSRNDDEDLKHILEFEKKKKIANQHHKSKQATLNPADLARIQRGSAVATRLIPGQSSMSAYTDDDGETSELSVSQVTRLEPLATKLDFLSPSKSNPHRNRYAAAVRKLESSPKDTVEYGNDTSPAASGVVAAGHEIHQDSEENPLLIEADPRASLISLSKSRPHSTMPKLAAKRTSSTRLPFETISLEDRKYNLTATPTEAFPSIAELRSLCSTLAQYDSYPKTGLIDGTVWLPASRDVGHWQHVLQDLLEKCYRARTAEGEDHSTPVVCTNISLSTALRAHVDSLP